jgi:hypothetical protein
MSANIATKYAAYFTPVVGNMITAEVLVKGLATTFHNKVQQVMTEAFEGRDYDGKEAATLHLDICVEIEKEMKDEIEKYYPRGTTLTEAVKAWKNYKSIYKNGMLMGLNPVDYETYSKFKTAKLAPPVQTVAPASNNEGNSNANKSGSPDNPASQDSGVTSNVAALVATESKLSSKVQARLALAVEELYKLAESDEETALSVVADFEGALRSKLRHNPRMVGMAQR